MPCLETILTEQEIKWILERRVTRLTDDKEIQIYPMGAERYLSSVLFKYKKNHYDLRSDIVEKNVLVIPGYANSSFLFAQAGAKSVTVCDKDPITIAWMKAFKKYYNYREYNDKGMPYPSIGELFGLLTGWYPALKKIPSGSYTNIIWWLVKPNLLRKKYVHYMLSLVINAVQTKSNANFELEKNIEFCVGTINDLIQNNEQRYFDTAFVPYLLGVKNGIETEQEITQFIELLLELVPMGNILVTPSQNLKQFYFMGKCYFETTKYENIQSIPSLEKYFVIEDQDWFGSQGLVVFNLSKIQR